VGLDECFGLAFDRLHLLPDCTVLVLYVLEGAQCAVDVVLVAVVEVRDESHLVVLLRAVYIHNG